MSHHDSGITITDRTQFESNDERHQLNVIDTCNSDITETSDTKIFTDPFRCKNIFMTIVTLVFYFVDVGSDIYIAYKYYSLKRVTEFGCTITFVVGPLIAINLRSLLYDILDAYAERKKISDAQHSARFRFLRVILTCPFMMGTVVRHIQYLYHGWKSRSARSNQERFQHYKLMLLERTRAGGLGMFEAFLENAPQLILQMYVMLTESTNSTDDLTRIYRPASMFLSWLGVSWSLVAYYKALKADDEDIILSNWATVFYFGWRSCEVGARLVLLALFASQFQWFTCIIVVVHWVLAIVLVFRRNCVCDKYILPSKFLISFVMIFCFQDIWWSRSLVKALLFCFYIENLVMLGLWAYYTSHKDDWYYIAAIVVVLLGMTLAIVIQALYYKCCDPKCDDI